MSNKIDDVFRYVDTLEEGDLHMRYDKATGMRAIIAIHSNRRGPALGGCRCIPYRSTNEALYDATRLARGMSFKSAIAGLPLGGGKAVIMQPPTITDRTAFFEAFGRFVNDIGGRYITAVDSGSSLTDMETVARQTEFVSCIRVPGFKDADPSPFTAIGVYHSIEAAVKFKLGQTSLEGLHVAVQGLGSVGYPLAESLHKAGARLTVCDVNAAQLEKAAQNLNATVVAPEDIYSVDCDVFAPCALGAVLNDVTVPQLKATIVAGSSNNQLALPEHGQLLHKRGILYAPDYVANAGGLIYASAQYFKTGQAQAIEDVHGIYNTLTEIFTRSEREQRPTSDLADIIAHERLYSTDNSHLSSL